MTVTPSIRFSFGSKYNKKRLGMAKYYYCEWVLLSLLGVDGCFNRTCK